MLVRDVTGANVVTQWPVVFHELQLRILKLCSTR